MDQGAAALRQFASSYGDDAEKRFIMFDHSGDKGRIMLEPNRFFEFDPRSPPAGDEGESEFHRVYREAMASFAAFQRSREANHNASETLCHLGGAKDSDSSVSKLSWDQQPGDEQQISSVVREEDSDDIDALLYSDDDDDGDMADEEEEEECSTGHTPLSALTREDSDEITSSFHGDAGAGFADGGDDEQQQQHEYVHEDGDEYDEGYGTAKATAAAAVAVRGDEASDDKSCKWSGYSGGGGGGGKRQPRLAARRRSVMKKQRKERIRRTVRTLQSIVPGGDSMDPAVVLDEAILYMKVLQTRVRQLEASRQEDLSSIAIAHA